MGGRQYYILEHRISSRYHRAGESQEIIVDQIEIGRASSCQVRFDESFATVSRRHAAIVREGDKWKLLQLSKTNPTFLNGNPVGHEWYLQSGDEIQLSIGGPKLGFIIPAANRTGTIGMTRRLSLFGKQALLPYRRAIALLSIALLLAIGGLTSWKLYGDKITGKQIMDLTEKADSLEQASIAQYELFQAQQDSITDALNNTKKNLAKTQQELANEKKRNAQMKKDLENRIKKLQTTPPQTTKPGKVGATTVNNKAIEACLPYVYFIFVDYVELILPNGEKRYLQNYKWSGTGFLLNDGRLVTARHIIEPWFFINNERDTTNIQVNLLANNLGKVTAHFVAISQSGDKFTFTSNNAVCDRSNDKTINFDGYQMKINNSDVNDWAYLKTNRKGGLTMDKQASKNLQRGVELTILGFPMGLGVNSANDIKPVWGTAKTASEGLNRGVILTTDTGFEQGNSGGPVFYTDPNGKLIVVGIVSGGAGRTTGFIVPISSIF
jgi:pSer/pThr/pTyr-binding forkhead associated (FHA) protein